jgi:hypothetical protein
MEGGAGEVRIAQISTFPLDVREAGRREDGATQLRVRPPCTGQVAAAEARVLGDEAG